MQKAGHTIPITRPYQVPFESNKWGGLFLDGNSGYVQVEDNNNLSVSTTGSLTIMMLMRLTQLEFTTAYASVDGPYVNPIAKIFPNNNREWEMRMYSKSSILRSNRISGYVFQLNLSFGTGSYFQDGIASGELIHVTLKIDNTNTYIFKNGIQRDTDAYVLTPGNGTAPVRIGAAYLISDGFSEEAFFEGLVHDAIIIAEPLTQAQIQDIMYGRRLPTDFNCSMWHDYRLGHARDLSGNGNHGTLNGNARFV